VFDVEYIRPQTLPEAMAFLGEAASDATILAGGTDVMIDMRSGALNTRYLLDVSRLPELREIDFHSGELAVGAAVTITEINRSEAIRQHAPALAIAAQKFAGRQVRNIATIGGNVAHCSPCGDTIPPLLIHDAVAVVVRPDGRRRVPVEEMAGGPYHCTLKADELITHFLLKPQPASVDFVDFQKIGRRKELAIARMSMAAMIAKDADRSLSFVRLALGSCTPTPHRFRAIEDFLVGKIPGESLLWEAGRMLSAAMLQVTGRRASASYKEPAIQGLFMRMMQPLVQSAGKPGSREAGKPE
jgi:CO/xanthine dehydrogenase FAD-binding subunit